MRNLIFAALVTAFLAPSVQAADVAVDERVSSPWDAFVSVSAGLASAEQDLFAGFQELDDALAIEGRGTAAYQFENGFGLQLDLSGQNQELNDFAEDELRSLDAAFHVFYRPSEHFLIGGFGQGTWSSTDDYLGYEMESDRFFGGGEAQVSIGNFTLSAQGGYQSIQAHTEPDPNGDPELDGVFINAELRYFATPDLKLHVRGGYRSLEGDIYSGAFLNYDISTIAGGVEYRLQSLPLSIFVDAEYNDHNFEHPFVPSGIEETRVVAGLKLNFGSGTLLERDRAGASLNPVRTSPVENSALFQTNLLP